MKNFALIGVAGYIARHLRAIKDTGNRLVALTTSLTAWESWIASFPKRPFSRRWNCSIVIVRIKGDDNRVDMVSICTP